MQDFDREIEEIEGQLNSLRVQVFMMKRKLRTKYYTELEREMDTLDKKLDSLKEQLEKSYDAETEKFNLQRENYFLKQGIGKEEMLRFIENMERRKK